MVQKDEFFLLRPEAGRLVSGRFQLFAGKPQKPFRRRTVSLSERSIWK